MPSPAQAPGISSVYNKQSSFFDNLSCETLERTSTKPDEKRSGKQISQEQRRLDTETFGSATMRDLRSHGHGRGRRYHSNRGGRSDGHNKVTTTNYPILCVFIIIARLHPSKRTVRMMLLCAHRVLLDILHLRCSFNKYTSLFAFFSSNAKSVKYTHLFISG